MSMCQMIICLVSRDAKVYAKDGVHSHSTLADLFEVDQDQCLSYEFHLDKRKLWQDFKMENASFKAKQSHNQAALSFFNHCAGNPEKLIAFVRRGNWREDELLPLLTPPAQAVYFQDYARSAAVRDKADAVAWAAYNKACAKSQAVCDKADAKAWAVWFQDYARSAAVRDHACAVAWIANNKARTKTLWAVYEKARAKSQAVCDKAHAVAWAKLFQHPENRIAIWK